MWRVIEKIKNKRVELAHCRTRRIGIKRERDSKNSSVRGVMQRVAKKIVQLRGGAWLHIEECEDWNQAEEGHEEHQVERRYAPGNKEDSTNEVYIDERKAWLYKEEREHWRNRAEEGREEQQ